MGGDYGAGRSALPESLAPALRTASIEYLDGALANAGLQPHHLLLILRNPAVTAALLQRIGRSPIWLKSYKLRVALVQHPRTPRPLALSLASSLRWGDLARVTTSARSPVTVRAVAEKILLLRLPELALGERISLARVAPPLVLHGLRRENSPLVARALLENPLLRYEEALSMAERPDAPPPLLQALAECTRFVGRRELRLALAAHPHTPSVVALRLVSALEEGSLVCLAASPAAPILVRLAAERRLASGPQAGGSTLT